MARFCPLFSGSSGNSTYIGTGDGGILIDAGVSAAKIKKALGERDIDLSHIQGIFVTHEHIDHISGIKVLASKNNIPVYLTEGTLQGIKERGMYYDTVDYRILGDETVAADMKITHFATSHDCIDSCGYVVQVGDRKIAVCTDLGVVTDEVKNAISGCDLVMLESNHDIMMLQNGKYDYALKRRVMSDVGHLSNNACSGELVRLLNSGSTQFVLAHLSRDNNTPDLAFETAKSTLFLAGAQESVDYLLTVAPPSEGKIITL
ncbi:MAG: MBL fold metallo-hydrolase [Clostridia bacterium]|nr:MBL fold metallo-hydrolase [Clostridia bacterium]